MENCNCPHHEEVSTRLNRNERDINEIGNAHREDIGKVYDRIGEVSKNSSDKYDGVVSNMGCMQNLIATKVSWHWFWALAVAIGVPLFVVGASIWKDYANRETIENMSKQVIIDNQRISVIEKNLEKLSTAMLAFSADRDDLKKTVLENREIQTKAALENREILKAIATEIESRHTK